jgi:hypothetical protein
MRTGVEKDRNMHVKKIIAVLLLGTTLAAPSPHVQAQTQQSESSVQSALRELRDNMQRPPAVVRPATDAASPPIRSAPKPCADAEASCSEGKEASTTPAKSKR